MAGTLPLTPPLFLKYTTHRSRGQGPTHAGEGTRNSKPRQRGLGKLTRREVKEGTSRGIPNWGPVGVPGRGP